MDEATQEGASVERLAGILNPPTATEAKPEPAKAEAVEAPEVATEATTETETEAPEVEASAEETEAAETEETTEEAEESAPLPQSLSELAERLGIEETALLSLRARTKIDGQEGEATLEQLLKSYQLDGHLTRKSMDLSEKTRALEKEAEAFKQASAERLQSLEDHLTLATQMLLGPYANLKWDELRATDPTEFSARWAEYQQTRDRLQQSWNVLNSERQKSQQETQKKADEFLKEERSKLMNALPAWKDTKAKEKDVSELIDYLKGYSFSEEEAVQILSSPMDHRFMLMFLDARNGKRMKEAKPQITKKVVQAPKLVKPGTKPTKAEVESDGLKDLQKKHRSGDQKAGIEWLKKAGIARI